MNEVRGVIYATARAAITLCDVLMNWTAVSVNII